MANLIEIPGVGSIEMDTQESISKAQAFLDIILLNGTYKHTNLDSAAQGSILDPFNREENPDDLALNGMGLNAVKIKGYTTSEWNAVFGTTSEYTPTNHIPDHVDTTASGIDQTKAQEARKTRRANEKASKAIAYREHIGGTGEVIEYTYDEWVAANPNPQDPPFGLNWPPGQSPLPDWTCTDGLVDFSDTCYHCDDACSVGNCPGGGLPSSPGICGGTAECPGIASYLQALCYISNSANGLQTTNVQKVKWMGCINLPGQTTFCENTNGGNSMVVLAKFGLNGIPPASPYSQWNGYSWQKWQDFMNDMIIAGYAGSNTDDIHSLVAALAADPNIPSVNPSSGHYGYIGTTAHSCMNLNGCGGWAAGVSCTFQGSSCNSQFCQNCQNASGNCTGNNSDGKIGWEILAIGACNSGNNSTFTWTVKDGGGNIVTSGVKDGVAGTSIITFGTGNPPAAVTSFSLICWESWGHAVGNYTCEITNFSGGGNSYPDMNISGQVLGNPPLNCITGDPNYSATCCSPPPPPPPDPDPEPDPDCPCEGAQNCEECGDNGNY